MYVCMNVCMYMYRYIAFIHPPKSTDPGFVCISTHFRFRFYFFSFLFLCCVKKEIETATTNHFEACTGQAVVGERACIQTTGNRQSYTHCWRMYNNNNKVRQSTTNYMFSFHIVRISEKEKKRKRENGILSYPIAPELISDRQVGSPSTLPSRSPVLPPRLCCQPLYRTRGPTVEDILGGEKSLVLQTPQKNKKKKENRKKRGFDHTQPRKNIHSKTKCTYVCMSYVTFIGSSKPPPGRINPNAHINRQICFAPTISLLPLSVTSKLNPITPRNEGCVTGVMISMYSTCTCSQDHLGLSQGNKEVLYE